MNYHYRIILAACVLVNVSVIGAQAESVDPCQDLVKDCFVASPDQRDSCIQTVATNSLCSSSALGALVEKRAQFGDVQQIAEEQGPAFLGPQIINRRCVSNFDTAWSAALVKGSLSNESIAHFSKALEECVTTESKALPRP